MELQVNSVRKEKTAYSQNRGRILNKIYRQRYLLLLSMPFMIWVIVFKYIPLWGVKFAFQDNNAGFVFASPKWVGLNNFKAIFADKEFYLALRNTLAMSFMNIIAGLTIPLGFAVLLNEIAHRKFKRVVQTLSYFPHFVSWVIGASMIYNVLSLSGVVNDVMMKLHIFSHPVDFMAREHWFWVIATLSSIWKETGWAAIIYISAMTAIDQSLYEAAAVDGAGRLRMMWHVTLPSIRRIIVIISIMSTSSILFSDFDRQMQLGNALVGRYSETLDIYSLNYGIGSMDFAYGTAVGLLQSGVGLFILLAANYIARKVSDAYIF